MQFLSRINFGSLYIYPSHGSPSTRTSEAKALVFDLKKDRVTSAGRIVDQVVSQLSRVLPWSDFRECLDGTATLVPMPRHRLQQPNSVWASQSLADSIAEAGLAASSLNVIRRAKPMRQSSLSERRDRPSPRQHFDTMALELSLFQAAPARIVMVDDVISRGSTFSGAAARLKSVFPDAEITALAIARTAQLSSAPLDPIGGVIHTLGDGSRARREDGRRVVQGRLL